MASYMAVQLLYVEAAFDCRLLCHLPKCALVLA